MYRENSCPDESLVKLALSGDSMAYEALLKKYNQKIQQMIYFYTGDQANLNDLVQEVMIKVFRYLPDYKADSKFSTWLYKITQNTIKNHFRTMSQRLSSEEQFANEYEANKYNSPEYEVSNIELGQQVESAIGRLSSELRQCYGMHVFEGKTYEDIAKKMHCPIGTVRSRIFRARKLVTGFVGYNNNSSF